MLTNSVEKHIAQFSFYISMLKEEYLGILIFCIVAISLALVIAILSYILTNQKPELEKLSSYECGFEPFDDARSSFDVHFYIVAILFMIFDIEIAFLLPWAYNLSYIGLLGFYSGLFFLVILTVGFYYEWVKGALNWSSLLGSDS